MAAVVWTDPLALCLACDFKSIICILTPASIGDGIDSCWLKQLGLFAWEEPFDMFFPLRADEEVGCWVSVKAW